MNTYIGTKIIQAEPAFRIDGKIYPESGPVPRSMNREEGYRVQCPDGYESWSPLEAFQEAYRPTEHMNFGLAIEAARKGKRIARKGWNGKGQYVELASAISYTSPGGETVNANHEAIGNHAFAFVGTSGVQMGWLASQADMLADDWTIVE